jgi:hypothetical protein
VLTPTRSIADIDDDVGQSHIVRFCKPSGHDRAVR